MSKSKILLVTAHPEVQSFNHALKDTAADILTKQGCEIRQSNLCQSGFGGAAGRADFAKFPENEPLDLISAQKTFGQYGGFVLEIRQEQYKLEWADAVILQFPIWWGSYPGILKGWIDRVLSYGFAYGRSKTLPAKTVMFSVTTGGAEDAKEKRAYDRRIMNMSDDVFGYMKWNALKPFVAHGVASISSEERTKLIENYRKHLQKEFCSKIGC
ncbi:MAG: NAD(P)H-dependent oxidoreductase [Calditrichia bacterium]